MDTCISVIGSAERIFYMVGGYNDHHTRLDVNISLSPLTSACSRIAKRLRLLSTADARRYEVLD